MYLSESLQSKWQPVLEHADLPAIKDPYKKAVTAVVLENQVQAMQKEVLSEMATAQGKKKKISQDTKNMLSMFLNFDLTQSVSAQGIMANQSVYQKMNEPQKSLEEYRKFHTVREQVEVEDSRRKLKNAKTIFEAEQTKKENAIIKRQKEEIEKKNAELQETIDELTRARVGKKARAVTLVIAIVLFIINDTILGTALHWLPTDNYFISLGVKMLIIFSLRPINGYVEKILFRRVMKERKRNESLQTSPEGLPPSDVQTAS